MFYVGSFVLFQKFPGCDEIRVRWSKVNHCNKADNHRSLFLLQSFTVIRVCVTIIVLLNAYIALLDSSVRRKRLLLYKNDVGAAAHGVFFVTESDPFW